MSKENLLKAIESAKGFGRCKYFNDDGKPLCVIGQLLVIEGANSYEFEKFNTLPICTLLENDDNKTKHYLSSYDAQLLDDLQSAWDSVGGCEEIIKEDMVNLVKSFYCE
jgi:hypothetical protein